MERQRKQFFKKKNKNMWKQIHEKKHENELKRHQTVSICLKRILKRRNELKTTTRKQKFKTKNEGLGGDVAVSGVMSGVWVGRWVVGRFGLVLGGWVRCCVAGWLCVGFGVRWWVG